MRKLLLMLLMVVMPLVASAQQVNTLPQKVEIKPREADRADDSLCVWGGISAGPSCSTVIVDSTGTLSVAASLADRSVALIKLKPGAITCTSGMVVTFNGTDFICSTVASVGGLTESGGPYVLTGAWRFDPGAVTGTVFGDTITPQQLVHIYNSGGGGGMRIQGNGGAYDLLSATNFTIGDTDIGTAFTIVNTTNNVEVTNDLQVGDDLTIVGELVLSTVTDDLIPTTSDAYDLGTESRYWDRLFISNVSSTVFNLNEAQLMNGEFIIGKYAGTLSGITSDNDTTVDLGIDSDQLPSGVTLPFWILVKAQSTSGSICSEYMTVTADNDGSSDLTVYTVTRDSGGDGTGDCTYADGTPWLMTGVNGIGRIHLNANVAGGRHPYIAIRHQGATVTAATDTIRLGDLTGMTQVNGTGTKYGLIVGDSADYIKYQMSNTNTVVDGDDGKFIVQGELRATSGWFGTSSTAGVTVDATGLLLVNSGGAIRYGKSSAASTTEGFWLGWDGVGPPGKVDFHIGNDTKYLWWDASAGTLAIRGTLNASDITAGTLSASFISAGTLSVDVTLTGNILTSATCQVSGSCIKITTSAIQAYRDGDSMWSVTTGFGKMQWNFLDGGVERAAYIGDTSPLDFGLDFRHELEESIQEAIGISWSTGITSGHNQYFVGWSDDSGATDYQYFTWRNEADSGSSWFPKTVIEVEGYGSGDGTFTTTFGFDPAGNGNGYVYFQGQDSQTLLRIVDGNLSTDPGSPWITGNGETLMINSSGSPLYLNNYSAQSIYLYGDGYTYLHKFGGPNIIQWRDTSGAAAPAFTTRSAGTRLVLYPEVSGSSADYGFGIEANTLWASVPTTAKTFTWYGGTTPLMSLQNSGGSNVELLLRGRSGISANGTYGVILTLQRSTGTANTPGMILWNSADNAFNFMWVDDSDQLRIGAAPEGDGSPANTDGTIVGTQTSQLEIKNILAEREASTGDALELVLKTRVFDFTYKNGSYNGETFTGIVTNYSPWFGMDGGRVLNNVNALGLMVLSVQNLQQQIVELEAELNELKVKVKDKKDPKPATNVSKKTKPDKTIPPIPIAPPPPVVVGGVQ